MTYSQQRSQRGRLTIPAIGCPRSRPPRSLVAVGMVGLLIGASALAGPWVNTNPRGGGAFPPSAAAPPGTPSAATTLPAPPPTFPHPPPRPTTPPSPAP